MTKLTASGVGCPHYAVHRIPASEDLLKIKRKQPATMAKLLPLLLAKLNR
jgi:hypothetical protein